MKLCEEVLAKKYNAQFNKDIIDVYLFKARFQQKSYDLNNSFKISRKAIALSMKYNYQSGLHNAYVILGGNYIMLRQIDEALKYAQLATKLPRRSKSIEQILVENSLTATIYFYDNKFDEAQKKFKEVLILNENLKLNNYTSTAHHYINLINFEEGNYQKLLNDLKEQLNEVETFNDEFSIYYEFVLTYNKLKSYHTAEKYLNEMKKLMDSNKNTSDRDVFEYLEVAIETHKGLGNFNKALELSETYNAKYKTYNEDLNAETVLKNQIAFETKEKEIQLKELTISKQQQELEILTQKNYNSVLLILIIFAIIASSIFLMAFIKNKRKNQLLSEKTQIISEKMILVEDQKKKLSQSLEERELLLKEIHHRVKNNLQLVISMMSIQARRENYSTIDDFVETSRKRITSMISIHQTLYEGETIGAIDLEAYVNTLVKEIASTFDSSERIKLQINTNDIHLPLATAIPFGLIVNEIVTNAFKHAFPNQKTGTISINLGKTDHEAYLLTIEDNGVGFDHDKQEKRSFGLDLIYLLVEQLNGLLLLESVDKTKYSITFQEIKE